MTSGSIEGALGAGGLAITGREASRGDGIGGGDGSFRNFFQ